MKKVAMPVFLIFWLLFVGQVHAAQVIWDGDYSSLKFFVEPNGGDFLNTSPFYISNNGATMTLSYDEAQGGGTAQLNSVASGNITDLDGAVQLNAMAKGPAGGVNPPNGTSAQAYAEIQLNDFQSTHGILVQQSVLSEISRKFSVDTQYEYELTAYLDGAIDFQSFGLEGTAYHAIYSLMANVSIDKYIVQGGALQYAGTVVSTDLGTERNRRIFVELSPTSGGDAVVYYLFVFLKLESDVSNITPGYSIAGPLQGPFQMGTAATPFELGARLVPKNLSPVADAGADQNVGEGQTVQLDGTGSYDPDGTIVYNWTQLAGTSVTLTGATLATPSFEAPIFPEGSPLKDTGEALEFRLRVTDDMGKTGTDVVIINVSDVNQAPVADAGADQTVNEKEQVFLDGTGSYDPDYPEGTTISAIWTQTSGPAVTLSDNTANEPNFYAPEVGPSGATLTFELEVTDDGGLKGTDSVTIYVQNVNQAPQFFPIGDRTVNEGEPLSFTLSASDEDGDDLIIWTTTNLPSGASLTDNGSGTASFEWQTDYNDARVFNVTFMVRDTVDPPLQDVETITITVNNVNQSPVLEPIGPQSVDEENTLEFKIHASDPDDDDLTYTTSYRPANATFDAQTQTFSWTPTYEQAGTYENIIFTVTDNGNPPQSDSEAITITVGNVNRPPVLDSIGDRDGDEGSPIVFQVNGTDPDGDQLNFSADNLPDGATFNDQTRTFTWTPAYDQAGTYDNIIFTVADSGNPQLSDSESIRISVDNINRPPVIASITDQVSNEGESLEFQVPATDPDGDGLTFSVGNFPEGATFDSQTQTFSWTPDYDQAGDYLNVTFAVTDKGNPPLSDSKTITITVENVNQPPVLEPIGHQSVGEGEPIEIQVSATDPDGDDLTCTADNLPDGALFDSGACTVDWTPEYDQAGTYTDITFTVTDNGDPQLTTSEAITITVENVNRPPVLEPIGHQSVDEGAAAPLTFQVTATDPDNDDLIYAAENLPDGADFDTETRTFSWVPTYDQAGAYTDIVFTATDNGDPALSASETVSISVGDINRPPEWDPIGNQEVEAGDIIELPISASDPDGDSLTITADPRPQGATLADNADGTALFSWEPGFISAGNYEVVFTVTDEGLLSDSKSIIITVGDYNRPPEWEPIGDQQVDEGEPLVFQISASDPDGDTLTITADSLPSNATLTDNADGTALFSWKPGYHDAGAYAVQFIVSDSGEPRENDTETVTITVDNVNAPPEIDPIEDQVVDEGEPLEIPISATDPDGDNLTIEADALPSGATLTDNTDGTALFSWVPGSENTGVYEVEINVFDDGTPSKTTSRPFSITVNSLLNTPPDPPELLSPVNGQTGESLTTTLTTTGGLYNEGYFDPEGDEHAQTQWQVSASSNFSLLVLDITSDTRLYALTLPASVLDPNRIYHWRARYVDMAGGVSDWSETRSFSTDAPFMDQNDNGIPDEQEVDEAIDLNRDGKPDIDQPGVIKVVETAYGNGQMGIVPVENVASIDSLQAFDPDAIGNKPDEMTLGLIGFKLTLIDQSNPIAKVDVYTSSPLTEEKWYKYDTIKGWQDFSSHAQFNDDLTIVRLTFEDGVSGDADGTANGIIIDPSGPAAALTTPPAPRGVDSGGGGGGCFISSAIY